MRAAVLQCLRSGDGARIFHPDFAARQSECAGRKIEPRRDAIGDHDLAGRTFQPARHGDIRGDCFAQPDPTGGVVVAKQCRRYVPPAARLQAPPEQGGEDVDGRNAELERARFLGARIRLADRRCRRAGVAHINAGTVTRLQKPVGDQPVERGHHRIARDTEEAREAARWRKARSVLQRAGEDLPAHTLIEFLMQRRAVGAVFIADGRDERGGRTFLRHAPVLRAHEPVGLAHNNFAPNRLAVCHRNEAPCRDDWRQHQTSIITITLAHGVHDDALRSKQVRMTIAKRRY